MVPKEAEQVLGSASSPKSPLLELPAELLHAIFEHLVTKDVLAARKACSTLASIGIDHFGDEMPLVYHRDKFEALTRIAQHSELSERMRSLFYIVDRFDKLTYEEWRRRSVAWKAPPTSAYLAETKGTEYSMALEGHDLTTAHEACAAKLAAADEGDLVDGYRSFLAKDDMEAVRHALDTARETRAARLAAVNKEDPLDGYRAFLAADDMEPIRHALDAAHKARKARIAAVYKRCLLDGYKAFFAICRDQTSINDDGYDYTCLRFFFQGCCNIREVTIASRVYCRRILGAQQTAFQKTLTQLNRDTIWSDAGADQVFAVVHAIERSGLKLDSLTIVGRAPTLFDKSTEKGKSMSHALRAAVRPLRRLRLFIHTLLAGSVDRTYWSEPSDSDSDSFVNHLFDDWIDASYHQSPHSDPVFNEGQAWEVLAGARELRVLKLRPPRLGNNLLAHFVRLDRTLRDIHYLHLYEIALSQWDVEGQWLVDFLLRHKATLRRISLSHMSLATARPGWRHVFTGISCQLPHLYKVKLFGQFCRVNSDPISFGLGKPSAYGRVMEEFLIRGGTYPTWRVWEPHDYDTDESDDSSSNDPPDHELPLDDPTLDYSRDEFDGYI